MPVKFMREGWKCDLCGEEYNTKEEAITTPKCHCQPMTPGGKRARCQGCYNDHYNQHRDGCWSLSTMFLQRRKKVHASDVPPWKHKPGIYPSCYQQPMHVFVRKDQEH